MQLRWPSLLLSTAFTTAPAIVLTTAPALAEPTAEERAVASDLFQEATQAEQEGEWASCERALAEAVGIVETPGLRFHLAYCKEQQKRWVEALVDYRRAQEMVTQGIDAKDVAELLPEAIERLDAQLPRLTLLLADVPDETTLYIDGSEHSTKLLGKPMPLDPGNRRVEVVAPGYDPFSSEFTLLPHERRDLEIVLVAAAREVALAPPPKPKPRRKAPRDEPLLSPKGWVLLSEAAVSAVALGAGIVFSIDESTHERDRDTILSNLGDPSACATQSSDERCALLRRASEQADDASTLATAAYITSAAGATALLVTWLVWPEGQREQDVAVGIVTGGQESWLSVSGRY